MFGLLGIKMFWIFETIILRDFSYLRVSAPFLIVYLEQHVFTSITID